MRHWIEIMQVGPFFHIERPQFIDFRHKGKPSDLWVSAAFAQCGHLQIELIQQRNDAPSMYRDFLEAGREGLQHVAFWHLPESYDAVLAKALASGFTVGMSAATIEPAGKLVYFEQEAHPGTVIELSCLSPKKKVVFDQIAEAAKNWDGSEPIRKIG
ncbi:VOC family protein [Bradyrhizobium manausense]